MISRIKKVILIKYKKENNMIAFNQESGIALVSVLLIGVFLTILVTAAFLSINTYNMSTLVQEDSDFALHSAQAGITEALFQFRSGQGGINWRGTFDANNQLVARDVLIPVDPLLEADDANFETVSVGTYTVELVDPPGLIQQGVWYNIPFEIIGRSIALDGRQSQRVLNVVIRAMDPSINIFTANGDLQINSGAQIEGNIFANRVNFSPVAAGDNTIVDGDINFISAITGQNQNNLNITGDINQVENIVFPTINMERFQQIGQQHAGPTTTLQGPFNGSDNPIIFVEGDLFIEGEVINGSVSIAATGNIFITGSLTTDPSNPSIQLGLFTENQVFVNSSARGQVDIDAFIMSRNGFEVQVDPSNPRGAADVLNFTGSMCIYGTNTGIPSLINSGDYLAANRSYTFNNEFLTNNTIPFMAFFAELQEYALVGDPI